MPLNVRPLSPALAEVARKELNEDPERTEQDVAHIREWLQKQPHINARTDDQWLLTFLRGCKFSLERTKEKLDSYYTMRTILPEFFANRDPMQPEIQEALKLGSHLPLPVLDENGRVIVVMRMGAMEPTKAGLYAMFKLNNMLLDIMLLESDEAIINGSHSVMDLQGVTMGHIVHMNPSIGKKMTIAFEQSYPVRPKGINYIHLPAIILSLFNLMKSFMTEKLQNRVFVHADFESLYKQVPKHLLPKEYGGDAGTIEEITAQWKTKVESYRDWFLEEEQYKTNEKKRPGKPKTHDNVFGLEGSFRQLNVD